MRLLHTESSSGWGGQEIRILRESMGMRARGHEVILAVVEGGGLVARARAEGFVVYEIPFRRPKALKAISQLKEVIKRHEIDLVNTHSSLDAWLGGISARLCGKKVVRTRHLSTPMKGKLNCYLLYNKLADHVVTTSSPIIAEIARLGRLSPERLLCVPTGIDPSLLTIDPGEVRAFRDSLGVKPTDILVGTTCFVRSWKGILDLLQAAIRLKEHTQIKWVIVGGGHVDQYRPKLKEWNLEGIVTFTGHLESPFAAMAAMDLFALLSTAHEGVSQATLQAAYLKRPMITTSVGGLPEVCLHEETGLVVPPFDPDAVAAAVLKLAEDSGLRAEFGEAGKRLVEKKFLMQHTLDAMEHVFFKEVP